MNFLKNNYIRSSFLGLLPLNGVVATGLVLFSLIFIFLPSIEDTKSLFLALLAISAFLISLVNTKAGLVIIIFSMFLSPEFSIGKLAYRQIVIRAEDIILIAVSFGWLAKMAVYKRLGLLKFTPLHLPLFLFIVICVISTLFGFMNATVKSMGSFFYILKYFEYFLLFFLVVNNLDSKQDAKRFLLMLFAVCMIVAVFTYPQILKGLKTSAPFEGDVSEPNTLGGYQVLMMAVASGLAIYVNKGFWKKISLALLVLTFPSFLFTLSRGSYIAFGFMYLTFIFLVKKKKGLLVILLITAIVVVPFILPDKIMERIMFTFSRGERFDVLGTQFRLEESAAARIETWQDIIKKWQSSPIIGLGVTGVKLADVQYALVLGETGLLGLGVFLWLMFSIFKNARLALSKEKDDWSKGLITGFMAGFVGLLFHSFSASTFIIIRIMEPFWFLTAIVVSLKFLNSEQPEGEIADIEYGRSEYGYSKP